MPLTNPNLKKTFVTNLRSGKYKQGQGVLRSTGNAFCCLGVLLDTYDPLAWRNFGIKHSIQPVMTHALQCENHDQYISDKGMEKLGITVEEQSKLAGFNDDGVPFNTIADWAEENL